MSVDERAYPVAGLVRPLTVALTMIALSLSRERVASADEAAVSPSPVVAAAKLTREPVGETSEVRRHLADGFYGGPEFKLTGVDGDVSVLGGVSAGWVLAKTVAFGLAGYTTFGEISADDASEAFRRPVRAALAYGGVRVGGFVVVSRPLRLTYGILVGGAGVGLSIDGETRRTHRTEAAPVVEPDVGLQLALTRGIRVVLALSYRFVTNDVHEDVGDIRMSAPSGTVGFSFGDF